MEPENGLITPETDGTFTGVQISLGLPPGKNEFIGLALPYGRGSDQNEVYAPGSLASENGQRVPVFYEHKLFIGVGLLSEFPSYGVTIRGRLMGSRLHVAMMWQAMCRQVLCSLCLTSNTTRSSKGRAENGEEFKVIEEAYAEECSIVLTAAINGARILMLGELDTSEDLPFDREALRGNFIDRIHLNQAELWRFWCLQQLKKNPNGKGADDEDLEQWLAELPL